MAKLMYLVFLACLIMGSGNLLAVAASDVKICYFHNVDCSTPLQLGAEIRLGYAEVKSISGITHITLEGDNRQETSASYAIPGAVLGGCGGCLYGIFGAYRLDWAVGGAILGGAIGGYVGSRSDATSKESAIFTGAVLAVGIGVIIWFIKRGALEKMYI